jgi:hypothetical protein
LSGPGTVTLWAWGPWTRLGCLLFGAPEGGGGGGAVCLGGDLRARSWGWFLTTRRICSEILKGCSDGSRPGPRGGVLLRGVGLGLRFRLRPAAANRPGYEQTATNKRESLVNWADSAPDAGSPCLRWVGSEAGEPLISPASVFLPTYGSVSWLWLSRIGSWTALPE